MDYKKLADLLYPNVTKTIDDYLKQYPKRRLNDGQEVARIAPSPTGYLHIGHVSSALLSRSLTNMTDGIFYFRLEDTDQKREIENAGDIAYDILCRFGLTPDEGYCGDDKPQKGEYGDYIQSRRLEIYDTFAKHIVSIGRAFPCFCDVASGKEEILKRREEELEQTDDLEVKDPCRDLSLDEIKNKLNEGKSFALRLKSCGDQ